MINFVLVEPSMFESIRLTRAVPKRAHQAEPTTPFVQETDRHGVPKWLMTLVVDTADATEIIKVSITRPVNPTVDLGTQVPVELHGLIARPNPNAKTGSGFSWTASDIVLASQQRSAA